MRAAFVTYEVTLCQHDVCIFITETDGRTVRGGRSVATPIRPLAAGLTAPCQSDYSLLTHLHTHTARTHILAKQLLRQTQSNHLFLRLIDGIGSSTVIISISMQTFITSMTLGVEAPLGKISQGRIFL